MDKYAAVLLIIVYAIYLADPIRNFIESDRAARRQMRRLEELLVRWIKEDEEERRSGDHANHNQS